MANGYAPLQIGLPTRRGKVSANRNDGIGPCAAKTGPSPLGRPKRLRYSAEASYRYPNQGRQKGNSG
jgi:hypothetical protein